MSRIVNIHEHDLPPNLDLGTEIAIDTETMGLKPHRDRLCLVQLSDGKGHVHLVQFKKSFKAPNLLKIINDPNVVKIFHYARFDMAFLMHYLKAEPKNIFCTKIASYLCRTYTDKHGLKNICKEVLEVEMEKGEQTSYWGADDLTKKQIDYATGDVVHLHKIKKIFEKRLLREDRLELARKCFQFLETRASLDLLFGEEFDIFAHRINR